MPRARAAGPGPGARRTRVTRHGSRAASRRIEAVLFDLDGVLVDSLPWWHDVRAGFAASHGREWSPDDDAAVSGANSLEWATITRDRLGLDGMEPGRILQAVVDEMVRRYRTRPAPEIDGAADTVRRVGGLLPVAVASSAHREIIDASLAAIRLEGAFAAIVSSDEVARGKPAPDAYLLAAARLGVDPARCLVVEDSVNGLRAARAAGMAVALVPGGDVLPGPGGTELADLVLDRIADLDPLAVPFRASTG